MARLRLAVPVFSIFYTLTLSAATRIEDPKTFVSDVYRQLIASQSGHDYTPPDDIYSARLAKLFRDDKRKAKGGVGCLEILFWVNGQDYVISDLTVTSAEQGPDRKTVTAKFMNIDRREEIHFDFLRNGRHDKGRRRAGILRAARHPGLKARDELNIAEVKIRLQ